MDNNKETLYTSPMGLTQQFRHCGNPFRIDTYKGCSFGCKYCFANTIKSNSTTGFCPADMSVVERMFSKALDSDEETKNICVEMLRNRVPLHLGGMSDPFQEAEFSIKATYKLLQLSNKYNYPIIMSTKQAHLPDEYWDVLNPKIHAFQISLFSDDLEIVRKFELNTPSPDERISFMRELKSRGFWVGVRIQPLINLESAISLVKKVSGFVDYITVEHLKICMNNKEQQKDLLDMTDIPPSKYKTSGRNYVLKSSVKLENIKLIKSVSKCPIGCGDNDIHEYSDSKCCCGVDTINENFDNWLKYNSMNINMTGNKDFWYPKCNCSGSFNSSCVRKGFNFADYVDEYMSQGACEKQSHFDYQMDFFSIIDN